MVRIYTRTGDDGTTGLIGGKRVPKDSPFVEACGTLDELNALLGVIRSGTLPDDVDGVLQLVQDDLFTLGAELATPAGTEPRAKAVDEDTVLGLEKTIDSFEARLEPLKKFILPGGTRAGAELHLARAVARRAERHCVTLSKTASIDPRILRYLNRLSDLCFVLARYLNSLEAKPEIHPRFGK